MVKTQLLRRLLALTIVMASSLSIHAVAQQGKETKEALAGVLRPNPRNFPLSFYPQSIPARIASKSIGVPLFLKA